MDFIQNKRFPWLVAFSAGIVAFSAAFFSVFGLSKLFSGAQMSVIFMAGSLEFSKLVIASFLYRYWDEIAKSLKYYLLFGTLVLILITSAGIFGDLSNAYQGATVQFEKQSTMLMFKEDQIKQLEEDKVFLKEELSIAITELPENYRTARKKVREEYSPQIKEMNLQILDIKQVLGDLKAALIETGVDVGPAIYLARIFETDIDTVVKYFILILIFVFDPLAVSLVIAANVTFEKSLGSTISLVKPKVQKKEKKIWEIYKDKLTKKHRDSEEKEVFKGGVDLRHINDEK